MKKFLFSILLFSLSCFGAEFSGVFVPPPGTSGNVLTSNGSKWTSQPTPGSCSWTSYTPTYAIGTWTTDKAYYCDQGSFIKVTIKATNTSAGSGVYSFSIPSVGKTINTTVFPTSTIGNWITSHTLNAGPVGHAYWSSAAHHQLAASCLAYVVSTTAVSVLCGAAANSTFSASGNAFSDRAAGIGSSAPGAGSSAYMTLTFEVPVQ